MDASAIDKAISILENDISGLERYVDSLEVWLKISSFAVVVGVFAEMYFVIHEYLDDRKEWRKGWISSPLKPSLLLLTLELLSVFLVVVGVAGELVVGIMSGNVNTSLRGKNASLVRLVRQRAGEASDRANFAQGMADKASKDLESARQKTARFEKSASDAQAALEAAQQKTATAQTEAAKAQEQAAKFFLDRLRWRSADPEKVRVDLAPPAPKARVELAYKPGDPEAEFFASTISQALKDIGWDAGTPIAYSGPISFPGQPESDVLLGTRIYFKPDSGAKMLKKGFAWTPNGVLAPSAARGLPGLSGSDRMAMLLGLASDARYFVGDESLPENFF
jgi:hypothetical protein